MRFPFSLDQNQKLSYRSKYHIFSPIGITTASFHRTSDLSNKAVSLSLRNEADRSLGPDVDRGAIIEHDPDHGKVVVSSGSVRIFNIVNLRSQFASSWCWPTHFSYRLSGPAEAHLKDSR